MSEIFQWISLQSQTVNEKVEEIYGPSDVKFSNVFYLLFKDTKGFNDNIKSWHNAIAKSWNYSILGDHIVNEIEEKYKKLGISTGNSLNFWKQELQNSQAGSYFYKGACSGNIANICCNYIGELIQTYEQLEHAEISEENKPMVEEFWNQWKKNLLVRAKIIDKLGELFQTDNFMQNVCVSGDKQCRVFSFWSYLFQIYPTLSWIKRRQHFHNIFNFMSGFKIEDTKVVIMGQDPPHDKESSGYAYHGTVCESTKNLIQFAINEFRLADLLNANGDNNSKLALSDIIAIQASCNLQGWIDQKVLLVNKALTIRNDGKDHFDVWKPFQDFLVGYFNNQARKIVFILTGNKPASLMSSIYQDKHLCINVYHPGLKSNQNTEEFRWTYRLPFLNANFYLVQNHQEPIDWSSVSTYNKDNLAAKRSTYLKCFDKMVKIHLKILPTVARNEFVNIKLHKNPNNKYLEFRKSESPMNDETIPFVIFIRAMGSFANVDEKKRRIMEEWRQSKQICLLNGLYLSDGDRDIVEFLREYCIRPSDIWKIRSVLLQGLGGDKENIDQVSKIVQNMDGLTLD